MKSDEALEQIAYLKELASKSRLTAAYGYKFYILWGILLIIGFFTADYFTPWLIWTIISLIGIIFTTLLILKDSHRDKSNSLLKKIAWQSLILTLSGLLIFYVIVKNEDFAVRIAFWPFQVGIIYLVASVHMGKDLSVIGLWMVAAAIASIFLPVAFQNYWLGLSCGGGLIVTGIIFRNQIKKIRG